MSQNCFINSEGNFAQPKATADVAGPFWLNKRESLNKKTFFTRRRFPLFLYQLDWYTNAYRRGSMVNVHWSVDRFCTEGPGFDSRKRKQRLISRMCNGPTKPSIPSQVG